MSNIHLRSSPVQTSNLREIGSLGNTDKDNSNIQTKEPGTGSKPEQTIEHNDYYNRENTSKNHTYGSVKVQ